MGVCAIGLVECRCLIWALSCSCSFPAWHAKYLWDSWLTFSLMSVFLLKERKGQENPSSAVFEALLWLQRQQMLENVSVLLFLLYTLPFMELFSYEGRVVRSLQWIATTSGIVWLCIWECCQGQCRKGAFEMANMCRDLEFLSIWEV